MEHYYIIIKTPEIQWPPKIPPNERKKKKKKRKRVREAFIETVVTKICHSLKQNYVRGQRQRRANCIPESQQTHKYILWARCRDFNVKQGSIYCDNTVL
jgi:hypothetical protein